jgi:hypothetical protein
LIRILGALLGGNLLLSALLISGAAALLACLLLYKEARQFCDAPAASRSVIYWLAFPAAFFLIGAYSESLFVLFLLLGWHFARRAQWPPALLCSVLAVMTRFQGIGIFLPLLYLWWRSPKPRSRWGAALPLLPLVPLLWSLYLGFGLHLDFPWQAQMGALSQRVSWPWTGIAGNLQVLLGMREYAAGRLTVALDWIVTLGTLALLVLGIRRLPLEYTLLGAVLILPVLVKVDPSGLLVSMSRLVLVLWPNFLVLGILGAKRIIHWTYLIPAFALQALGSAMFFLWFWIA